MQQSEVKKSRSWPGLMECSTFRALDAKGVNFREGPHIRHTAAPATPFGAFAILVVLPPGKKPSRAQLCARSVPVTGRLTPGSTASD